MIKAVAWTLYLNEVRNTEPNRKHKALELLYTKTKVLDTIVIKGESIIMVDIPDDELKRITKINKK